MLEQDAGRKAHRKFSASSAIETGLSQINDPKQGARLGVLTDHRPYGSPGDRSHGREDWVSCSCGLLAGRPRSGVPSICVAASRSNATTILFMSSPGPVVDLHQRAYWTWQLGRTGATLKRRSEQKGGNEATRVFGRNAQTPAIRPSARQGLIR